jgi:hypothetical protein
MSSTAKRAEGPSEEKWGIVLLYFKNVLDL